MDFGYAVGVVLLWDRLMAEGDTRLPWLIARHGAGPFTVMSTRHITRCTLCGAEEDAKHGADCGGVSDSRRIEQVEVQGTGAWIDADDLRLAS